MISEGIGGIIFSRNIAKQITKYAKLGLFFTESEIISGIELKVLRNKISKFNIYIIQIYKVPPQIH